MEAIRVKFKNEAYNYTTSVNPEATEESLKDYFIGTQFDLGIFPKEDFQRCIDLEFIE